MNLNGIICIAKPAGFTSFDVIAKLRGIIKQKRIGHAGTLDPMATGVLPIFIGKATRAVDILPINDKVYEAGFTLGITTDTQDITGKVLNTSTGFNVTKSQILDGIKPLTGDIMQVPPMFSAVSVNGQRLYDLARKGITIPRTSREITIHSFKIIQYNPLTHNGIFEIHCSKGTYIRTLIHDLGESLGCGAVMTSLIRTKAAGFSLDQCISFEDIEKINKDYPESFLSQFSKKIIPVEQVFLPLSKLQLDEIQTNMYKNGVKLDMGRINFNGSAHRVGVYSHDDVFLGTSFITGDELVIEKNFFI